MAFIPRDPTLPMWPEDSKCPFAGKSSITLSEIRSISDWYLKGEKRENVSKILDRYFPTPEEKEKLMLDLIHPQSSRFSGDIQPCERTHPFPASFESLVALHVMRRFKCLHGMEHHERIHKADEASILTTMANAFNIIPSICPRFEVDTPNIDALNHLLKIIQPRISCPPQYIQFASVYTGLDMRCSQKRNGYTTISFHYGPIGSTHVNPVTSPFRFDAILDNGYLTDIGRYSAEKVWRREENKIIYFVSNYLWTVNPNLPGPIVTRGSYIFQESLQKWGSIENTFNRCPMSNRTGLYIQALTCPYLLFTFLLCMNTTEVPVTLVNMIAVRIPEFTALGHLIPDYIGERDDILDGNVMRIFQEIENPSIGYRLNEYVMPVEAKKWGRQVPGDDWRKREYFKDHIEKIFGNKSPREHRLEFAKTMLTSHLPSGPDQWGYLRQSALIVINHIKYQTLRNSAKRKRE